MQRKTEYKTIDEFFKNSTYTSIAEDVRKEIVEENAKELIDSNILKMNQTWSKLANQVIGGEI